MQPVVTIRCLGRKGRFGNQLFQYAYARALAERFGAVLQTPRWIGQELFDIDDPPVSVDLSVHDDDAIPESPNVDLCGYFQRERHLSLLRRAKLQAWFAFRPEWRDRFPKTEPYAAAHLRRGDYVRYSDKYCLVSVASYERACERFGIDYDALAWAKEDSHEPPDLSRRGLGFLKDFMTLANADVLLRANSTFSWWAGALGQGKVFSSVVGDRIGPQDVEFAEGNHPKIFPGFDDLHLKDLRQAQRARRRSNVFAKPNHSRTGRLSSAILPRPSDSVEGCIVMSTSPSTLHPSDSSDGRNETSPFRFTTVVGVDREHIAELELVWPTWKKFRPELLGQPLLLVCDGDVSEQEWERRLRFLDHPDRRIALWKAGAATQREKMLSALVFATAEHVETEWYLNLDTDVVATGPTLWVDPTWFAPSSGKPPAFVAPPLARPFPAEWNEILETWGDAAPSLAGRPRLNVARRVRRRRLQGGRFIGWALFGNAAFTRRVAADCRGRLPVASQDTVLWYAAERAGESWRAVDMARLGLAHCRPHRLTKLCRLVLSTFETAAEAPPTPSLPVVAGSTLLPLPPPLSCQGPLPRTLVFAAVDDGENCRAMESWFDNGGSREFEVALAYRGNDPDGVVARSLRRHADRFDVGCGDKFRLLLQQVDRDPALLDGFDYVLLPDDDVVLSPETIGRMARIAREYGLSVCSPGFSAESKPGWFHMIRRGGGPRASELPAGVELCNFVGTKCVLLRTDAVREFLDLLRRIDERTIRADSDLLLANACYRDDRPFGVLHNVGVDVASVRSGRRRSRRAGTARNGKDLLERWRNLSTRHGLSLGCPDDVRAWLPPPRMRCINLDRATERRERFSRDWIAGLKFPIEFFSAFDRREVDAGNLYFPYDDAAAHRRAGRGLTPGEIACATSHALVMREESEFCGPEGVFIFEDDCYPLPGAERILERIREAANALPGVEVVACHKPHVRFVASERAGGAARLRKPPWGTVATWYSPSGLRRSLEIMARMNGPADWLWRELCGSGALATLDPPIAWHEISDTTYIGNEHRGVPRRFIP